MKGWLAMLLLLPTVAVWANGDPVAVHSALTLSPTPMAVHVPEVQLVDEAVHFTPRGRYMEVTVRYLLHNRSSRTFDSLPYGFPIDYWGQGDTHWAYIDDIFESQMEKGWRDSYIRNVSFRLGDRELPWRCSKDTLLLPPKPYLNEAFFDTTSPEGRRVFDSQYAIYGDSVYSYTHEISRRWYYTYLHLPANSFATLEVRYSAECTLKQGLYARDNYLIANAWYMLFMYDFTPASYWGDGHADRFNVELDASDIVPRARYTLQSSIDTGDILPMQRSESVWRYSATRFDLAAAKPFVLAYNLKGPMPQPLDRLLNHRISPNRYTVDLSGADRRYPAANLSDLDLATATVLKPDKDDSLHITLRFPKPTAVYALLLVNGYTKNADTWQANSRIDSLTVLATTPYFTYFDYETGKMDTTANEDRRSHLRLLGGHDNVRPLPVKYPHGEPHGYDIQSLIDNALIITLGNIYSNTHVSEIKIHIAATAKGTRHDDLCISEILLIE